MNLIQAEIFGKRVHTHGGGGSPLKLGRKETAVTPKLASEFGLSTEGGGSKLVKTLKAMKFKNVASDYVKQNHHSPEPHRGRFRELNSSCNSRKDHSGIRRDVHQHFPNFAEIRGPPTPLMETGEAVISTTEMFKDRGLQLFTPGPEVQQFLTEELHTEHDLNRLPPHLDLQHMVDYNQQVNPCFGCGNEAYPSQAQFSYTQFIQDQSPPMQVLPSNRYKSEDKNRSPSQQDQSGKTSKSAHHQTHQNLVNVPIVTSDMRELVQPTIFVDQAGSQPRSFAPAGIIVNQEGIQATNSSEMTQPNNITVESSMNGVQRKGVYQMSQGKKKMIDSQHIFQLQNSGHHLESTCGAQYSSMNHANFGAGVDSGHFISSTNTAILAGDSHHGAQQSLCPQCSQPSQPSINQLQYGQSKYDSPITTTITIVKSEHQEQEPDLTPAAQQHNHDQELNRRVLERNPERFNRMAAYLPKRFLARPLRIQEMRLPTALDAERPNAHSNITNPYGQQDELFSSLNNQVIHHDIVATNLHLANALAAYQHQNISDERGVRTQKVHKLVYDPVSEQIPAIQMDGQGNETDIAGSDCQQNITISDRVHDVTVSDHAYDPQGSKMTEQKSITPRQFMEYDVNNQSILQNNQGSSNRGGFQTMQDRMVKSQGGTRIQQQRRPVTKTSDHVNQEPAGFTNLKQFKAKKKMKVESPSGQSFIVEDPTVSKYGQDSAKHGTIQSPRIRSSMNRSITSVNSSVQSKHVRQSNRTPLNQLTPQDIVHREYTANSEDFKQFN